MSEAEELKLLDALAEKCGYPNWKEYMRKHTAVFFPVGVNSLMHSFAIIAVNEISLARKEGKLERLKEISEDLIDVKVYCGREVKKAEVRVRLETAKEIFDELEKEVLESDGHFGDFWQMDKKEYDEFKNRFLSKPQSDNKGEEK